MVFPFLLAISRSLQIETAGGTYPVLSLHAPTFTTILTNNTGATCYKKHSIRKFIQTHKFNGITFIYYI
jgi:hypothetical protein